MARDISRSECFLDGQHVHYHDSLVYGSLSHSADSVKHHMDHNDELYRVVLGLHASESIRQLHETHDHLHASRRSIDHSHLHGEYLARHSGSRDGSKLAQSSGILHDEYHVELCSDHLSRNESHHGESKLDIDHVHDRYRDFHSRRNESSHNEQLGYDGLDHDYSHSGINKLLLFLME